MEGIFSECVLLTTLPDISKWNLSGVENIKGMFYKCSSLKVLPDIWKWETKNVTFMNYIFFGCSSLKDIPNLDKWNTNNVLLKEGMFQECNSLKNIPKLNFENREENDSFSKSILSENNHKLLDFAQFQTLLENSMSNISGFHLDSNITFLLTDSKNSNSTEINFNSTLSMNGNEICFENKCIGLNSSPELDDFYEHFYD